MESLTEINLPLYHAYICYFDSDTLSRRIESHIRLLVPDALITTTDHSDGIGVHDIHSITHHIHTARSKNQPAILIVQTTSITIPAQNKLLKSLEEMGKGNYVFLCVPHDVSLLPTVVSRCRELYCIGKKEKIDGEKFFTLPLQERFSTIDALIEGQDKNKISQFLNTLEMIYHARILKKGGGGENEIRLYASLTRAREYLRDPSVSLKQILRDIAVTV